MFPAGFLVPYQYLVRLNSQTFVFSKKLPPDNTASKPSNHQSVSQSLRNISKYSTIG
ncbi:hypothetical protein DESC_910002 [Desulfosarcina cetonica]|nr:hypothetical protein DESC_910002 [Desulfosarcina cetonica]